MAWVLVHHVGRADLALARAGGQPFRPVVANRVEAARTHELGNDANLLSDGQFTTGAAGGLTDLSTGRHHRPLSWLTEQVTTHHVDTDQRTDVHLRLVSTEDTRGIAEALAGAIRAFGSAALAGGDHWRLVTIEHATVEIADPTSALSAARRIAFHHRDDRIAIELEHGATRLAMSLVAGLTDANADWVGLLRRPDRGIDEVGWRPRRLEDDLLRWMFRLGIPPEPAMLDRSGLPADQKSAIDAYTTPLRRARLWSSQEPLTTLAELTEHVRACVRRDDSTGGIPVRRWIEENYRAMLRDDQPNRLDTLDGWRIRTGPTDTSVAATLGVKVAAIAEQTLEPRQANRHDRGTNYHPDAPAILAQDLTHADHWLVGQNTRALASNAAASAHDYRPLSESTMRRIGRWTLPDLPTTAEPLPSLSMPSRRIAIVQPVGDPASARAFAERLQNAERLLAEGILGHGAVLGADVLWITSDEHGAPADHEAFARDAWQSPGQFASAAVHPVTLAPHTDITARAVDDWLCGLDRDPEAIVVTTSGRTAHTVAAYAAAVDFGRARAVPVLLDITEATSNEPVFHPAGFGPGADRLLATIAWQVFTSAFSLDAAARLLSVGTAEQGELAGQIRTLIRWLRSTPPTAPGSNLGPYVADHLQFHAGLLDLVPEPSPDWAGVHLVVAARGLPRVRTLREAGMTERERNVIDKVLRMRDDLPMGHREDLDPVKIAAALRDADRAWRRRRCDGSAERHLASLTRLRASSGIA